MSASSRLSCAAGVAPSVFDWRRLRSRLSRRPRISHAAMAMDPRVCRDHRLLQDIGLLWCDVAYGSSDKPAGPGL